MKQQSYIAGLDVGSSSVTLAVRLVDERGGGSDQVFYAMSPSRGVTGNVVSNGYDVQGVIRNVCAQAERKLGFRIETVNLTLTGGRVKCAPYAARLKCEGKEANSNFTIISEADLQQIENKIIQYALSNTQVVFDREPVRYLADNREIRGSKVGTYAEEFGCDYNLFIAEKEYRDKLLRAVRNSGLEIASICLGARATAMSILNQEQRIRGVAVLDIGLERSELVVYENDRIQHYAWIAIGGAHVTRDIMERFGDRYEEAERRKLSEVNLVIRSADEGGDGGSIISSDEMTPDGSPTLGGVVKFRLHDLVEHVASALRSWGVAGLLSNNHGLLITGGGAVLPGCAEFMERSFHLDLIGIPLRVAYGAPATFELVSCDESQTVSSTMLLSSSIGLLHLAEQMGRIAVVKGSVPPVEQESVSENMPVEQELVEDNSFISKFFSRARSFLGGLVGSPEDEEFVDD